MISQNIITYLIFGIALWGMTFLPRALDRHPLTLPPIYILAGILIYHLPFGFSPLEITWNDKEAGFIEYATELIVIISLAGAGIRLDRSFSLSSWTSGWRLLGITMPLTILLIAISGHYFLGLVPATAILLGACLAPTDPVLADDVQVGTPHEGKEDEVRFGLTLEAGLNDALAFPFVYLAITAVGQETVGPWLLHWFGIDFLYRLVAGGIIGYFAGRFLAYYIRNHSSIPEEESQGHSETTEGIFVIAAILIVYSLTELAEGYGFLAVFVAAVTAKRLTDEKYNKLIFRFVVQIERLLLAGILIGFGGMLTQDPSIFLDARVWSIAAIAVFLIRPITGYIAFLFSPIPKAERAAIAFFGIRGIGSIYYLAYALRKEEFPGKEILWPAVAATILLSVVIHGLSVSPLMSRLDIGKA